MAAGPLVLKLLHSSPALLGGEQKSQGGGERTYKGDGTKSLALRLPSRRELKGG